MSVPRLAFLFRKKSDEEKRYFEVAPGRRWAMAALYFGLIGFLVMSLSHSRIEPPAALTIAPTSSQAHW